MARTKLALIVTVALLASIPLPSEAHTFSAATSLSIQKTLGAKKALISGALRSGEPTCPPGQLVRLIRKGKGAIKSDVTDNEGEYSFNVNRGKKKKKVFAQFGGTQDTSYGHSHTCLPSESRVVGVKKKKKN